VGNSLMYKVMNSSELAIATVYNNQIVLCPVCLIHCKVGNLLVILTHYVLPNNLCRWKLALKIACTLSLNTTKASKTRKILWIGFLSISFCLLCSSLGSSNPSVAG
jgi:hypothetical protein